MDTTPEGMNRHILLSMKMTLNEYGLANAHSFVFLEVVRSLSNPPKTATVLYIPSSNNV